MSSPAPRPWQFSLKNALTCILGLCVLLAVHRADEVAGIVLGGACVAMVATFHGSRAGFLAGVAGGSLATGLVFGVVGFGWSLVARPPLLGPVGYAVLFGIQGLFLGAIVGVLFGGPLVLARLRAQEPPPAYQPRDFVTYASPGDRPQTTGASSLSLAATREARQQ
jgi:hypothetical protein